MRKPLRLGVNIDHVATIRNARGGAHPDPVAAALLAQQAGADGITAHLREDRRHIRDEDMVQLKNKLTIPLNFEMAATHEMQKIALSIMPHAVCLVPENREEVTTEGGLNVVGQYDRLREYIIPLQQAGIRVSLFIDADTNQINASHAMGAPVIELHTGAYAQGNTQELNHIIKGAALADKLGLECHAGHGLTYDNVKPIAEIQSILELNIGHFLIGEAISVGLPAVIAQMRALMQQARL